MRLGIEVTQGVHALPVAVAGDAGGFDMLAIHQHIEGRVTDAGRLVEVDDGFLTKSGLLLQPGAEPAHFYSGLFGGVQGGGRPQLRLVGIQGPQVQLGFIPAQFVELASPTAEIYDQEGERLHASKRIGIGEGEWVGALQKMGNEQSPTLPVGRLVLVLYEGAIEQAEGKRLPIGTEPGPTALRIAWAVPGHFPQLVGSRRQGLAAWRLIAIGSEKKTRSIRMQGEKTYCTHPFISFFDDCGWRKTNRKRPKNERKENRPRKQCAAGPCDEPCARTHSATRGTNCWPPGFPA